MSSTLISILALALAFVGFVAQQLRAQKTASTDYVKGLETRIDSLEDNLKGANARVVELEGENLRLMRRLLANGGTTK